MNKILVTGSCGFIFSNFINKVLNEERDFVFVSVDKLVHHYNHFNINNDHKFYVGDVADVKFMDNLFRIEKPDIVIHASAESFVDDSISQALPFVHSNVLGTQVAVDMAIKYKIKRFIYVSTDEVYGQLRTKNEWPWTEDMPINPRNPYAASKAAGELIVKAAHETHGLQYNITRCCNNFGPRQPPRNLIPKIITCLLNKDDVPIHGNGENIREWIYVDDHISAIMTVLKNGKRNEIYNIGSGNEYSNNQMVKNIQNILRIEHSSGMIIDASDFITYIKNRPGHDFRYAVDCNKLKQLGWSIKNSFEDDLLKCVEWYKKNRWYFD